MSTLSQTPLHTHICSICDEEYECYVIGCPFIDNETEVMCDDCAQDEQDEYDDGPDNNEIDTSEDEE